MPDGPGPLNAATSWIEPMGTRLRSMVSAWAAFAVKANVAAARAVIEACFNGFLVILSGLLRDEMDWSALSSETGFRGVRKKTCTGVEGNTRRDRFMGIERGWGGEVPLDEG